MLYNKNNINQLIFHGDIQIIKSGVRRGIFRHGVDLRVSIHFELPRKKKHTDSQ